MPRLYPRRSVRRMATDTYTPYRRGPVPGDRLDTPVRELMRPGVIVVGEDTPIVQVQRTLVAHHVHAVLVLENGTGRPLGWVTSSGLLRNFVHADAALRPARDAVTDPAVTIVPAAPAREALDMLSEDGVSRLLVSRCVDGLPEGVLTDVDLLRVVARR